MSSVPMIKGIRNVIYLTGHTSIGCFEDYRQIILSDFYLYDYSMTNEYCADYCCSQSHMSTYMGTEVCIIEAAKTVKPVETEL